MDALFGIVEGYGGHGIGRHMHMDPFLPNEGAPGRGPLLAPGSVLAIEPMLTLGTGKTVVLDDEWTVTTADGSRAAHWEHTVAVTEGEPRILTLSRGLELNTYSTRVNMAEVIEWLVGPAPRLPKPL